MQVDSSSRPKIPLPTGWSDSSDDNKAGLCGHDTQAVEGQGSGVGGGGGWDSSSDENGGGSWGGGKFREEAGGIRNFERMAAESMREALLKNDAQLCDVATCVESQESDARGSCDSDDAQGQDAHMSERFVPGDPFAAEKADVEAWAKHFTYLSITPSASWAPPREDEASSSPTFGDLHATRLGIDSNMPVSPEIGSLADPGHDERSEAPKDFNAPVEHDDPVIVGVAITSSHPGQEALLEGTIVSNENATISKGAQGSSSGSSSSRAFSTRFCAGQHGEGTNEAADSKRSTPHAHFQGLTGAEEHTPTPLAPDEDQGELIAYHGTYETFLAYDQRPPLTPSDDDRHQETTQGEASVGATPTSSTRLSPPQREIKEEIMDRLFEELWNRLIPELSMAATAASTNHNSDHARTKPERTAFDARIAGSSREEERTLSSRQ